MNDPVRASLGSQIGNEPCPVEDTEEIFWLREADDYRSRFLLGNALAAQYRFKEAAAAYEKAMRIRQDDWKLHYSLGGAYLTLRRFGEARSAYSQSALHGAPEKTLAYPLGVACYLQGEYAQAAPHFKNCLPCGDEMAIAVIYWHSLSCYRAGCSPSLLSAYHKDMEVGHHTAYRLAVSVFCGETPWEEAVSQTIAGTDDLHDVVALYGLCVYLAHSGNQAAARQCAEAVLHRENVWPCISYLAAWNDANTA